MNNPFQIFNHSVFGEVRVAIRNGEPWFVGNDVAKALGYSRSDKALSRYVLPEHKTYALVPLHCHSKSGEEVEGPTLIPLQRISKSVVGEGSTRRRMTIINESGLYSLILAANTPEAMEFKHWVTSEVLPAIRKTGSYSLFDKAELVPAEPVDEAAPVTLSAEDKRLLVDLCAVAPEPLKEQLVRQTANLLIGQTLF